MASQSLVPKAWVSLCQPGSKHTTKYCSLRTSRDWWKATKVARKVELTVYRKAKKLSETQG